MCAVEDLDARALVGVLEWERDGPQFGGKLLVRQAGDVDVALDVGDLRDRLLALLGRGVGQRSLGELDVLQVHFFELAFAVGLQHDRDGVGSFAAGERQISVARRRVDGQVVDHNLLDVGAQQRGDLAVDVHELEFAFGGRGAVAGVDGEDGGALGVADEQDAFRTEG